MQKKKSVNSVPPKRKKIVEAIVTNPEFAKEAYNVLSSLQKMFSLSESVGLNALHSAEACGWAMHAIIREFHESGANNFAEFKPPINLTIPNTKVTLTNEKIDLLDKVFPGAITPADIERDVNSIRNSAVAFATQNVKIFNASKLEAYTKSKANKDDLDEMCSILYTSKSLNFLSQKARDYVKSGSFSEVGKRVNEFLKEIINATSVTKRVAKLMEHSGLLGHIAQKYNISTKNPEQAFKEILTKCFEVKEKGLSNEQVDMILESSNRLDGTKKITDRIKVKGDLGEMNFISFLKLFSNKYYNHYIKYLLYKSSFNPDAMPASEFLELYNTILPEDRGKVFQGTSVTCTVQQLNSLSPMERELVLPRLAESAFLQLEFHIQLERVQLWMHHGHEVGLDILDENITKMNKAISDGVKGGSKKKQVTQQLQQTSAAENFYY